MARSGFIGGRGAARIPHQDRRGGAPGFEIDRLEQRVMLSVFWDGGAGTNSWHDKANWSNDTLPGPGDDVVISVQDEPNVTFSSGSATVASITTNEDFTITGGNLSVTGAFTASTHITTVGGGTLSVGDLFHQTQGELRYNGGTIAAMPELSNAALKLGGGTGSVTFALGGGSTISGDIGAAQTVWIRGANFGTNAHVTAAGSFTNAGTLRFESQDLAWETFLTISSGMLTNTGKIEARLGSDGPNRLLGSVENKGTLNIQSGATLSLELGGGHEFKQSAGTSTITGNLIASNGAVTLSGGTVSVAGTLRIASGSFTWTGGTLTGSTTIAGSALTLGPGATSAADFILHGSVIFSGDIASGQTVWVQGADDFGAANVTAPSSVTNAGLLRVESINSAWDSAITLQNNSVLTNTGTIEANAGSGGTRSISGKLTNNGVVAIASGVTLFVGPFTQGPGGRLDIGIQGAGDGEFGKLQSSGAVGLAGEFKAEYLNGFIPVKFDSIRFITAASVSGQFDAVTLPYHDPDPDIKTLLVYSKNDVRLLVTSRADINNDGKLDLFDFLDFVNLFNAKDPAADFTGDGKFDLFDFLLFFNVFNK